MSDDLQFERDLMAEAGKNISEAVAGHSPGEATSIIFAAYSQLCNVDERNAFVGVLASRLAVSEYLRAPS